MTTRGFPLKTVTENITLMGRHPNELFSPLEQAMLDMMTRPIQSAAEMALRQTTDFAMGYSATWPDPLTGALSEASQAVRDLDALLAGR